MLLHVQAQPLHWFCIFMQCSAPLHFSLANPQRKCPHQHSRAVKTEAQRHVGARPTDARWPGGGQGLHLSRIILMKLGAHGWLVIRSLAQKWCWYSWWLQTVKWLIQKAVTGKKVEGWSKAGARGVPRSIQFKHCWSKRQICRTTKHTVPILFFE